MLILYHKSNSVVQIWLQDSGYKTELSVAEQIKNSIPVDILGKIANIRVEKDKIEIEIDLRKATKQEYQQYRNFFI